MEEGLTNGEAGVERREGVVFRKEGFGLQLLLRAVLLFLSLLL